jgi:hypothetical protein
VPGTKDFLLNESHVLILVHFFIWDTSSDDNKIDLIYAYKNRVFVLNFLFQIKLGRDVKCSRRTAIYYCPSNFWNKIYYVQRRKDSSSYILVKEFSLSFLPLSCLPLQISISLLGYLIVFIHGLKLKHGGHGYWCIDSFNFCGKKSFSGPTAAARYQVLA